MRCIMWIKMVRYSLLFTLLGIFMGSCTLSTEQEMNLNRDIHQFIQIRNEGDALSFLNYMHPSIVRYYKNLGDSTFIEKFNIAAQNSNFASNEKEIVKWNQGYIKKVIKKGKRIEAKIEISLIREQRPIDSTLTYYAISSNNSSNWLFASQKDYTHILNKTERLFQ